MKKIIRKLIAVALAALLIAALSGCSGGNQSSTNTGNTNTGASSGSSGITAVSVETAADSIDVNYSKEDKADTWADDATTIALAGDTATVTGDGASVSGGVVTVTDAGSYVISGSLSEGVVEVNASDDAVVQLVLNGADISCSSGAAINVLSADKVVITLADGTKNIVSSTAQADANGSIPSAIDSHDDLTFNGGGSLTVTSKNDVGIKSNDSLKIVNGDISVTSGGDAIKGQDSVSIKDGTLTLNAGADGIESSNTEEEGRGFISIEGGTISITAALDGIQAATDLLISGGTFNITTGGGSANSSQSNNDWGQWQGGNQAQQQADTEARDSAKGIKATGDISITGGNFVIDSSDDSIHSNGSISISSGVFQAASGDDGIHADTAISISSGKITLSQSYEGIESANISISGGEIHVVSSDDGINISGGSDSSSTNRPGANTFTDTSDEMLAISGGYMYVDAAGDGLDSNGAIAMTGGTVLICGPEDNSNGALDFSTFSIDGGLLIAAGSSGMALLPDDTSTQNSIGVAFSNTLEADTLVSLVSSDGTEIVTFAPAKTFQSIVISSPDIKTGATYKVYTGGSDTGTAIDGLYSGDGYTAGSEAATLTVSSTVTSSGQFSEPMEGGSGSGNMGGPGGGRSGGGPGGKQG